MVEQNNGLEFLAGKLEYCCIAWQSITPLKTKTGNIKRKETATIKIDMLPLQ